jgi:hypothetical protein
MLGTNLSIRGDNNTWVTQADRLLTMDTDGFNMLGLGIDDLIDAYVQTVLSVISIDQMCIELLDGDEATSGSKELNVALFKRLNPDDHLFNEIHF